MRCSFIQLKGSVGASPISHSLWSNVLCLPPLHVKGFSERLFKSNLTFTLGLLSLRNLAVNGQIRHVTILGNPGAVSRVDKMSVVKVGVRSRRAPGQLLLPNQLTFQKQLNCPLLIGQKKLFSAQSAKRSSLVTLMFSYTTSFSSSIAVVA